MTGLGYEFLVLSQDTNQKSGRVEAIYHNVIFVILALVVASSLADLLEPRWKLCRRQPRPIKKVLREA